MTWCPHAGVHAPLRCRSQWPSSTADVPDDPDSAAPRVGGLHLQFGADAATEVVVSWHTAAPVRHPRVHYGTPADGFREVADAETTGYLDAMSGKEILAHHARLTALRPGANYVYAAVHDGAEPALGTVRTAPRGRAPLRFTSFGDQGSPMLNAARKGRFVSDSIGSPAAGDITAAVERTRPLFNLCNGDLAYANLSGDRIRAWSDWLENNSRSARHRPWMPAAGNHENELGNGPVGYAAYQSYFALPDSGAGPGLHGLWYAFTAGSVRVISLNNDDVCYQDAGNSYIRGYSGGAQKCWLEAELARTAADGDIDWIVVCMHQTAVSTGDGTNGADLGVRENWLPLFDRYGVDLVLCGHEHHYERSHPCRGTLPTGVLTPRPVGADPLTVDTSSGTVHVMAGAGGTSVPSNRMLFPDARCRVLVGVGEVDPVSGLRVPRYVEEAAVWSAVRDVENPCGFLVFDVDPGPPGGPTTMTGTYLAVRGPYGDTEVVDRFVLTRPRRG
ncbi:purple acid phosphatase family protein [[Mycobacterium] manitobense]|uniref:purple acid phosphatase family protein n=1 Tax=[Mycobacterium] manitobense TaxID=190147 RepID=UPI0035576A6B